MFKLAAKASAEIEIKKSRFLGHLYPVSNRAEARTTLEQIRREHPNAVHVCWVLLCNGDSGLDDDGEPSGTAAKPMYNVLTHKQLHQVLAVVVRYWGGIKLGAGGLSRAYGQAISEACKVATLIEIENTIDLRYLVPFADEAMVRRLCEQHSVVLLQADYQQQVQLDLRLRVAMIDEFERLLNHQLKGNLIKIRRNTSQTQK